MGVTRLAMQYERDPWRGEIVDSSELPNGLLRSMR